MPTYTYICETCGTEFEAFASIQKKEAGWRPDCPRCGSPQTRQTYKAAASLISSRQPQSGGGCCSPRRGASR